MAQGNGTTSQPCNHKMPTFLLVSLQLQLLLCMKIVQDSDMELYSGYAWLAEA